MADVSRKLSQRLSRKDFLKAAGVTGALGVSGSLLGARAAQGHEGSHGGGKGAGGAGQTGMDSMVHNITEGVGIAAPILKDRERPSLWHFAGLVLLGGAPAMLGTWIAGFAYSSLLATIFLAIAVGALMLVIYEVGQMLLRGAAESKIPALSMLNMGGLTAGIAVMYLTGLLTL